MTAGINAYDVLIIGGGTAGCVLAARLSSNPDRSVCLVEAGPDYGPFADGRWPTEMTDPRTLPDSHDWEPGAEMSLSRARVIGGCSAHNGCVVAWGHPSDYDEWVAPGWDFASIEPHLRAAESAIGARRAEKAELGPWARAVVSGAEAAGVPVLDDLNQPTDGAGFIPVNARDSARWSTAFAYLDPARERPNLTVLDRALGDRILLDGGRAVEAVVIRDEREISVTAGMIVICAGAYGSPLILLRSGIGPLDHLAERGVERVVALPGVGANLRDHFGTTIAFHPSDGLQASLAAQERQGRMLCLRAIIKGRSADCPPGTWDLHLVSWSERDEDATDAEWRVSLTAYVMKPASTGVVGLKDASASSHPNVDLGYLSDPDGRDLSTLLDGVALARRIAATAPVSSQIEGELEPGTELTDTEAFLRENVRGYFHPVGTCAMGTDPSDGAVVDGSCRVHGIEGLLVCDASVMPTIPRTNTALTTMAIAERIATEHA